MKRICLVFSLAFLFFVAACDSNFDNKDNKGNPSTESDTIVITQDYFILEEENPAIEGEIRDGGLWLSFFKDQILPVGVTDEDSYRLPDEPIQVEGLKGAPKCFIIADIGQDYNPVLCVLTDKGKVQMLSLWNAVTTGDLEVTEIPMEQIVGFKAGPGGPWEDEDGDIFYEYTTIYGIDTQGGEHEVPMYILENYLEYIDHGHDSDVVYQLFFSNDWKMRFVKGYYLGETMEEQVGRFWLLNEDWDNMVFRFGYEFTTCMEYTGEDIKTSEVKRSGVFEIRQDVIGSHVYTVTPIEGVDFCDKGMNVPVSFGPGSAYGG